VTAYRADLLSDTLTLPTDGMRAAMAAAEVGDDVFGEDPTVCALEEDVAGLLGHEAALFTPTGSMANQLGLRLHVAPGRELLADSDAHVVRAELGAAAAFSGITSRTWRADRGRLEVSGPLDLVAVGCGPYQVETALVVVENTHNFGGGTVQPLPVIEELRAATSRAGVAMHLDGARLWNASVATGVPLADYGRAFDTVSVCLSKGLGAPVGSLLVGSRARMDEARVWRKRYGGGMRQVGILAAAGRYALEHHLHRLADDHARASRFAYAVREVAPQVVDPQHVETNIVMLDVVAVGLAPAAVVAALAERSVRAYAVDARRIRCVWHLGVGDDATDHAIHAVRSVLLEDRGAGGETPG
jgi:threonine aldolase